MHVHAQRRGGGIDPAHLKPQNQKWLGGQQHALAASLPGQTACPFCGTLVGSRSRSGRVRKISPLSGSDPRTGRPVASRCSDYAIEVALNRRNSYEDVRKVFQSKTGEEGSREIRTQYALEIDASITYMASREKANEKRRFLLLEYV
jgi:hypothetical protein